MIKRWLFIIGLLIAGIIVSPLFARSVPLHPVPEHYQEVPLGMCSLVLPPKNMGLVKVLAQTCTEDAETIYHQLGLSEELEKEEKPSIEVRIVDKPQLMDQMGPKGISLPKWSGAVAFPNANLVILPMWRRDGSSEQALETVLAHEISHLAFHRAAAGTTVPRWFSEGVAILQSEGNSITRKKSIWWASFTNSIQSLSSIEVYPEDGTSAELAYAQAADFVAFLVDKDGWNGISYVLSQLKQGLGFNDAFKMSYGTTVAAVEKEWNEQLFGSTNWIAVLTGTGALWGLMTVLFVIAYVVVRRRKQRRLKEMEEEEQPLDHLIGELEQMIDDSPSKSDCTSLSSPTKSKIDVDGQIHTLH